MNIAVADRVVAAEAFIAITAGGGVIVATAAVDIAVAAEWRLCYYFCYF